MKAPLLPMLATRASPFDDEEYEFEVKWDGVRALAAVEAAGWRLWGRSGTDYTPRYPELAERLVTLVQLPPEETDTGFAQLLQSETRQQLAALKPAFTADGTVTASGVKGQSSDSSTARNASWGISTCPTCFIRFFPAACLAHSFRFRVMSPP